MSHPAGGTGPPGGAARRLWVASAFGSMSVWLVQIAVSIHVLQRHSVATFATVALVGSLPALVCTPLAGLCADRYDARRVALIAVGAQVGCLGAMASTLGSGLPLLTALFAGQGVAAAFWPPARQRWLYGVVAPDRRARANAAIGSITGLMTLVGAAGGGVLSSWGPGLALAVGAGVQATALGVLLAAGRPPSDGERPARRPVRTELREGVRATRRLPLARSVVWIGIAWGFVGGGYTVLLTGHVTQDLAGSAILLGAFFVADGLSVLLATVLAGRLRREWHIPAYAIAYVVQGVAWSLTFAAATVPLALGALVSMRLASGFVIALDTSILLDTVPDRLRGRVTSLHLTTYSGVGRLSLAVLAGLLTVVAIPTVGVVTGIASAVFGVVWWLRSGRHTRFAYLSALDETARTDPAPGRL